MNDINHPWDGSHHDEPWGDHTGNGRYLGAGTSRRTAKSAPGRPQGTSSEEEPPGGRQDHGTQPPANGGSDATAQTKGRAAPGATTQGGSTPTGRRRRGRRTQGA